MVSKILFLLGMSPVMLMFMSFLWCVVDKKTREASATAGSIMNAVVAIASGALLLLSALTAHTLGW